jgi:hypothetical protein
MRIKSSLICIVVLLLSVTLVGSSYGGGHLTANLVLHLEFDDANDITVDSSPIGQEGEAAADGSAEPGHTTDAKIGTGAAVFDGATTALHYCDPDDSLQADEGLTVMSWVNTPGRADSNQCPVCFGNANDEWNFYIGPEGHLGAELALKDPVSQGVPNINENGHWQTGNTEMRISFDEWVHMAFTYDGANGTIYLNGEMAFQAEAIGPINKSDRCLTVGEWLSWIPLAWIPLGRVDDAAVWLIALTQGEIQTVMNNGVAAGVIAVEAAGKLATTWADIKR